MKIILATPVYPPEISAPAIYIKQLALKLRDKHDVTIVAYASTSERIDGTTLFTISKQRPLPFRLLKYFITLYNASKDADVIYVQNAMAAGLPAVLVGKLRKIKVVLKFLGDEAWEHAIRESQTEKRLEEFFKKPDGGIRGRVRIGIQGFVLRNANVVTTPSSYLRAVIMQKYRLKDERVLVNYDAVITDPEAPFPATPVPHQIFITTESTDWKILDGIIRAIAIVEKKYSDVRAIIVGDQFEEEKMKTLATELGVAENIRFTGRISRTEISHVQKSSEVCVLNSMYESIPRTVLTSFAAHTPVVAIDTPALREAVQNNTNGLLLPAIDETTLAVAIARIFDDKALKIKLIDGAEKIIKEKFSWDTHLKTLLGFFESIRSKPAN